MGKSKSKNKKGKIANKDKLLKLLKSIRPRIPVPRPGVAFKSKKDYNRSDNKTIIRRELND